MSAAELAAPTRVGAQVDARRAWRDQPPRAAVLDLGPCRWFARCDRQATHLEPHPVLPPVPACDRCPAIGRSA